MRTYAVINFRRTNLNGSIEIIQASDDPKNFKLEEHDEIVVVFEEDGETYMSRNLDYPRKEFYADYKLILGSNGKTYPASLSTGEIIGM